MKKFVILLIVILSSSSSSLSQEIQKTEVFYAGLGFISQARDVDKKYK